MCRVQYFPVAWLVALLFSGCEGSTEVETGTIEATSVTTGEPTDPGGYTLTVDGDQGRTFGTNELLTIADLSAGDHELQLLDVAPHCTLAGENPRTVTVPAGAVARTTFEVQCSNPTGSIEVTTTTGGESLDPDGYAVALDGGAGQPIGTNGSMSFTAVIAGNHLVQLIGAAPNCVVGGENPRPVAVGSDVATVGFAITCQPPTGTIGVTAITGGLHLDPNGYTVSLDGGPGQPIGINGTLTSPGIPLGDHALQLSGLAANCALGGDNPVTVTVAEGAVATVVLQVNCLGFGTSTLLFASTRSGTSHLYKIRDDGSELTNLTPSIEVFDGDWSPDGSKIVLNASSGIRVMNADGSGSVALGVHGEGPRWSPDGSKIAFEFEGNVRVMDADGSNAVTLTTGHRPDWSPDGTRIAFDRLSTTGCVLGIICTEDLYVMGADGAQVVLLRHNGGCAAWSPDGSKIAYNSLFLGVYVVTANGSGSIQVAGSGAGCPVVWSPDGEAIAYQGAQSNGTSELMVIPSSGGPGAVIASSPASEFPESWR
jgi:Tol biopolymer transport system component